MAVSAGRSGGEFGYQVRLPGRWTAGPRARAWRQRASEGARPSRNIWRTA